MSSILLAATPSGTAPQLAPANLEYQRSGNAWRIAACSAAALPEQKQGQ